MTRENVKTKLNELLSVYITASSIDHSCDIMAEPLLLSEQETASFFLDVGGIFSVDLNELVPNLSIYSIDAIADKLLDLREDSNVCCL
jgi:hypothetical protein